MSEHEALRALADAHDLGAMRLALRELVRLGYRWAALGGKEGNYGLVNIGSDPGIAFVERITNAIDAVIEEAAAHTDPALVANLESPREAARALFAIPEGRLDLALVATDALASHIVVSLEEGPTAKRPMLEVRDDGCGIAPADMPSTILNLAGSNKLAKPYLAGAYGQGGSTTFAFSPGGTIIASATDVSDLGVTVVQYRDLDPRRNKNGRYDYLVRADGDIGRLPRDLQVRRGTVVRHLAYELTGYDGPIDAPRGGLAALARVALFDPILPFEMVERRGLFEQRVRFAGHFAELQSAGDERIEYRGACALPFGPHGRDGLVEIRCWVLADDDATLNSDPAHPVYVTNFGQTHGLEDRRFIVERLELPYLRNALVVQIELDGVGAAAKRALLSTTRDRLKRGARTRDLFEAVVEALREDEQLRTCNAQRRQRLLSARTATDQKRLRHRFATLLEKFHPGTEPAAVRGRGAGNAAAAAAVGGESDGAASSEPLPTLAHPTFVRIVTANGALVLPRGRLARVTLESDAPDGYLTRYAEARLVVVAAPFEAAEFVRASDLRGGRLRAMVRAVGDVGTQGTLTARLTDAEGRVHDDSAPFSVVAPPPPEPAAPNGAARVRVPEIYEVYRAEWAQHRFDERSVASVAESPEEFTIWVNMDNLHLQRLLDGVPYQEQGIARMKTAFLVQSAFYAFLLHEAREHSDGLDPEALERYQAAELDRLAQTVISSIASVERLDTALFESN
ncbi:MAG: hypothetical protein ACREM2_00015 [Vulcanimicrobiaceae bacterium]